MTVQPTYHWQFNEGAGSVSTDRISGVKATFAKSALQLHGRIGNAVLVHGGSGAINLGKEVGQFGTSDFTIAFGILIRDNHDQNDLDIIGNCSVKGHGNWVSLRLLEKTKLFFEVDEDSNGKHYIAARTNPLALRDKTGIMSRLYAKDPRSSSISMGNYRRKLHQARVLPISLTAMI
ncbi:MAG: hypothetical protein HC822_27595 [Oscillochloris sp.]|nr:hypothetical protein [Oscillochloris sp.]